MGVYIWNLTQVYQKQRITINMRILHLVGSPSSELAFQCSQLYAKSLLQSDYAAVINNTNIVAVVHLDGSWSFPQNCDKLYSSLLENARRRLSNKILNDDSLTHTKGRMASIA